MIREAPDTERPRPDLRERALCLGPAELADVDSSRWSSVPARTERARGARGPPAGQRGHARRDRAARRPRPRRRRGFGPAKATRILAALESGGAPRSGHSPSSGGPSNPSTPSWRGPGRGSRRSSTRRCGSSRWTAGTGSAAHTVWPRAGCTAARYLPRERPRPALRDGASAMVLLHNHPSGDPSPSIDDVR